MYISIQRFGVGMYMYLQKNKIQKNIYIKAPVRLIWEWW